MKWVTLAVIAIIPVVYLSGYSAGKAKAKIKEVEKIVYLQNESAKNTKDIDLKAKNTKKIIKNAEKNEDCNHILNYNISKCLQ